MPSVKRVNGGDDYFANGDKKRYDAIVFATGYKSTDDGGFFNEDGMPKKSNPDHWKGENGLYCAGFARAGDYLEYPMMLKLYRETLVRF
ncbi:hypothetical protein BUALT_Bualt08G0109700 [Buddleja alternifolia]|uniref:Flavin-containing monooxygenase n=1 Tax=Buddleja alternifolia TaxID=168488 RepID=A0AAV6XCH1_9LAMI|nr:hypothetical protein BUALT_Bualt08G0109700 [Buddleja alternifolia]